MRVAILPVAALPSVSLDSRRLAVAASGKVLLLSTTGNRVGSLTVAGDPVVWQRGVGLLVFAGRQAQYVLRSPDGRQRPRLLFRLPKNQLVLVIDAR